MIGRPSELPGANLDLLFDGGGAKGVERGGACRAGFRMKVSRPISPTAAWGWAQSVWWKIDCQLTGRILTSHG